MKMPPPVYSEPEFSDPLCRNAHRVYSCTKLSGHQGLHCSIYHPGICWDDYGSQLDANVSTYCAAQTHGSTSRAVCILPVDHPTGLHRDGYGNAWVVGSNPAQRYPMGCGSAYRAADGSVQLCYLSVPHKQHVSVQNYCWNDTPSDARPRCGVVGEDSGNVAVCAVQGSHDLHVSQQGFAWYINAEVVGQGRRTPRTRAQRKHRRKN